MPEERDPLEALRSEWRALEAPAPDAELDAPDARTEAAVEWMRSAWSALEVPAPSIADSRVEMPRAAHLFGGGPSRLAWLAAAAALLIASLPVMRAALDARAPEVVLTGPEIASVAEPAPRLTALERPDDAIAMREGPVTLVLLMPSPPAPSRGGR